MILHRGLSYRSPEPLEPDKKWPTGIEAWWPYDETEMPDQTMNHAVRRLPDSNSGNDTWAISMHNGSMNYGPLSKSMSLFLPRRNKPYRKDWSNDSQLGQDLEENGLSFAHVVFRLNHEENLNDLDVSGRPIRYSIDGSSRETKEPKYGRKRFRIGS
jgi:hypothetical protein